MTSGAWGDDPWGRFAFRWYTERGWTEHVSDGVTEALDPPGERRPVTAPPAAVASAPAATSTWTNQPAVRPAVVAAPEPARQAAKVAASSSESASSSASSSSSPRRWPLVALGMVGAFALGGWIFGRGDGTAVAPSAFGTDSGSSEVSETVPPSDSLTEIATGSSVESMAASADPSAAAVEDTTAGTVSVPATVPPPIDPPTVAAAPIKPEGMPDADWAARNDAAIDDLEWGLITTVGTEFAFALPSRDEVVAIGTTLCQLAVSSPTIGDWELGFGAHVAASPLPAGQFGLLVGAASGAMCLEPLMKLGIVPTL